MPTYAESKLAPEHYGFPIFYELLPLDDVLAEEASAIEPDRDAFGDGFDDYRASQLDLVRSVYAAGSAAGTAYSVPAPHGEWSSAIVLADRCWPRRPYERREAGSKPLGEE